MAADNQIQVKSFSWSYHSHVKHLGSLISELIHGIFVFQKLLNPWGFFFPGSLHRMVWARVVTLFVWEIRGEWSDCSELNYHSLQPWSAEQHHTTHHTLTWMSCNSRRVYQVSLLSAKNKDLRLQWEQTHQNWIYLGDYVPMIASNSCGWQEWNLLCSSAVVPWDLMCRECWDAFLLATFVKSDYLSGFLTD